MKKLIPLIFICCCLKLHAQTKDITKAFSAGIELAAPSGGVYNIGVGASAKFELPVASPVSFVITGGFTSMFYKSNLFKSSRTPGAAIFIPLKAGLKYYFARNFYAEGEAGSAIETNYDKRRSFAFSIGPGFIVPLNNEKQGIDFGFRYESWANQLRQTGIRVAYHFGL